MKKLLTKLKVKFAALKSKAMFFLNYAYRHGTCAPRWNGVETTFSTSFQRGIHVLCL